MWSYHVKEFVLVSHRLIMFSIAMDKNGMNNALLLLIL